MDRNDYPQLHLLQCGGQARKSLWIETINHTPRCYDVLGQARKSLWIETQWRQKYRERFFGQARKSLWIETL